MSDVTQILSAIEQGDLKASEQLLDEFVKNQAAEMGEPESSQDQKRPANADWLSFLLNAIERVKPYKNNPHQNLGSVDAVAASIREFAFRQAIIVDESGVIIVGHTRLRAAQKLGLEQVSAHVANRLKSAAFD